MSQAVIEMMRARIQKRQDAALPKKLSQRAALLQDMMEYGKKEYSFSHSHARRWALSLLPRIQKRLARGIIG